MPYNLTDAIGQQLSFERPPERVVSLIPSITESLFELGLAGRIEGISKYCVYPSGLVDGKRKVGGQKNPDFDAIADINPDLIILNKEENKPEHIEELRQKYPVWVTFPRRYFDTLELLDQLGGIFEVDVKSYKKEIQDGPVTLQQERDARKRVLFLIWRNPWMSLNRDTFIHDVLALHGLDNVFADRDERYFEVTVNDIVRANPEVIVLPDEPYTFLEKHKAEFMDLPVDAVKNNHLLLADGSYFCWYGTRTAGTSRYIKNSILSRLT